MLCDLTNSCLEYLFPKLGTGYPYSGTLLFRHEANRSTCGENHFDITA